VAAQVAVTTSATAAIQSPPPIPTAAAQPQPTANEAVAPEVKTSEAAQAAGGNGWWIGITAAVAAAVSLMAVAWGVWAYLQDEPVDFSIAQATSEEAAAPVGVDEPSKKQAVSTPTTNEVLRDHVNDRAASIPPSDKEREQNDREPPKSVAEVGDAERVEKQEHVAAQAKAANETVVEADATPKTQAAAPDGDHTAAKPMLELSDEPKSEAGKVAAEAEGAIALPDLPATVGDAAEQQAPLVTPVAKEESNAPVVDDVAPAETPLRRIAPEKIDVSAQLAQKMPAIELEHLPLYRFASLASQLGNVPIAIDVDGLRCRGIALDTPIDVSSRAASLGKAIESALAPHRLELGLADGHAIVRPVDAGKTRKARYMVGDLARGGDPAITDLAETIRGVLGLPVDDQNEGARLEVATDTFYLTATDETHDRMIELCEKLRVARGRPLRTKFDPARPDARFDPRRFELSTRKSRAKGMLSRPVTAGIGTGAPLSAVVEYLSRRSGAVILIDAAALAEAELSVHTECRLQADDEPLAAALAGVLGPLDLTYRIVDEKTIQITTPAAAAEKPDIELYSLRGLAEVDEAGAFLARLEQRLMEAAGKDSLELAFDPPSQALIVTAPSAVQAKVEEALGRLRSVEAAAGEKVSGVVR
jgi:hypothetical protein